MILTIFQVKKRGDHDISLSISGKPLMTPHAFRLNHNDKEIKPAYWCDSNVSDRPSRWATSSTSRLTRKLNSKPHKSSINSFAKAEKNLAVNSLQRKEFVISHDHNFRDDSYLRSSVPSAAKTNISFTPSFMKKVVTRQPLQSSNYECEISDFDNM
jgi:hypothetical protein